MPVSYFNIPGGYAGTAETIRRMEDLVQQGKVNPEIIAQATEIVRNIPAKDYEGEARALFQWVKNNIRYTRDPNGAELLCAPWVTLKRKAGDCDCGSVLLNSLAEAIGLRTGFETVKADRKNPDEFSHVFSVIETPAGWQPADVTVSTSYFGWRPTKGVAAKQDWIEGVAKAPPRRPQGVQGMSGSSFVNAADMRRMAVTGKASSKLAALERADADAYMARAGKREQLRKRLHAKISARRRQQMDQQGVRLSGLGSADHAAATRQMAGKIGKIYAQQPVPIWDRIPYPSSTKLRPVPENFVPRLDNGSLKDIPFNPAVGLKNELIERYAVPPDQAHMLASNAMDRFETLTRQKQIAHPSQNYKADNFVPYFAVSMTSPSQVPASDFGTELSGLGEVESSAGKWLLLAAGAGLAIYLLKKKR